jgi:hypothetical protein
MILFGLGGRSLTVVRTRVLWYVAVCATIDISSGIVYALFPARRDLFTTEDMLIESLSAATFLTAFVLGIFVLRRRITGNGARDRGLVHFATWAGLVLFLEEISYGERMFKLKMPHVAGIKLDSFHDVLFVTYTKLKPSLTTAHVLVAGAVAVALLLIFGMRAAERLKVLNRCGPFPFVLAFAALIGLSQISDLRIVMWEHRRFFEELFEFNAAIALVAAILSAGAGGTRADPP